MTISLAQTSAQNNNFGGTNPSVTVTLGSPTTAGNCLVVAAVTTSVGTATTVSGVTLGGSADNFGSLYSEGNPATSNSVLTWWADPNCAGGQTSVVVSTAGGSGTGYIAASVFEVSGLASTLGALLDQSSGNDHTASNVTSFTSNATGTTANPNELWLGLVGSYNLHPTFTGPSSPWNNLAQQTTNAALSSLAGYQIVSSTGTATYSGTMTSADYVAAVITLNGAAPAPAGFAVTATQGGTGTDNGIALTVKVLTGAAAAAGQGGASGSSGTTTTPNGSITPRATGSYVYGAVANLAAATAFTPAAGNTFSQNVLYSGDGDTFGTFRVNATTTASIQVTAGASGPTEVSGLINWCAAEILANGTLAEDASSPAGVNTTTATTVSTAGFTPPAGSLLVAQVSCNYVGSGTLTMTVSGGGLTWTQIVGETVDLASVWVAQVPAAAAGQPAGGQPGPVRARIPAAQQRMAGAGPRGRVTSNPGGPVRNPVPGTPGPVFYPARWPARAKIPVPRLIPRGRVSSGKGAPVANPRQGPVFRQAVRPVRAPVPRTFSKGRVLFTPPYMPPPLTTNPLAIGLTLTAGGVNAWQYIGPVPLTYLQYMDPEGVLAVIPGEGFTELGPASGFPYSLPSPPPDGRWVIVGTGGVVYDFLRRDELDPPPDDLAWDPPPALAHLPMPFGLIAERIARKRRRT